MEFREAFLLQTRNHHHYTPQDAVKLCYQAAFGPSHMLGNPDRAREFLQEECHRLNGSSEPLWEEITEDLVRLNLRPWIGEGLPLSWLFSLFQMTAELQPKGADTFFDYISAVSQLASDGLLPFSNEAFMAWYEDYLSGGVRAVSHSDVYREVNAPAYRLISGRYLELIPVLKAIHGDPGIHVIAIDGMAGSGKTTLADALVRVLGCQVIRMDDFFLPRSLRTKERLAETGGNIHYERFAREIVPNIRKEHEFCYRRFDCGIMDYAGEVFVDACKLILVEGSYSCHPRFGDYMDLRVFVETDPETQLERISQRDIPGWMAERFRESWIPMEHRYHREFQIPEKAHIVIKT